jgi:hypothetical protein
MPSILQLRIMTSNKRDSEKITKPDKKDIVALCIAALQTVALPFVLLLIVLVILYIFLVIVW